MNLGLESNMSFFFKVNMLSIFSRRISFLVFLFVVICKIRLCILFLVFCEKNNFWVVFLSNLLMFDNLGSVNRLI